MMSFSCGFRVISHMTFTAHMTFVSRTLCPWAKISNFQTAHFLQCAGIGSITVATLKGSYDIAKKNIILCIWCNAMCLCGLRIKKHILYIIVAPLSPAFLKRSDFYKAHRSEKRDVLWLASYPVRCDWPNPSSVRRKCYAPHRNVMPCPGVARQKQ